MGRQRRGLGRRARRRRRGGRLRERRGGDADRPGRWASQLYMARYPPGPAGAVYFLQWQRRNDAVDGTLTIVAPAATDATSRTRPVVGEIDGRRVTLEVGTDDPQH